MTSWDLNLFISVLMSYHPIICVHPLSLPHYLYLSLYLSFSLSLSSLSFSLSLSSLSQSLSSLSLFPVLSLSLSLFIYLFLLSLTLSFSLLFFLRRLAPCVVYLDEVDSVLSSRENGDDSSHGTLTSVKTTLMQVCRKNV